MEMVEMYRLVRESQRLVRAQASEIRKLQMIAIAFALCILFTTVMTLVHRGACS